MQTNGFAFDAVGSENMSWDIQSDSLYNSYLNGGGFFIIYAATTESWSIVGDIEMSRG